MKQDLGHYLQVIMLSILRLNGRKLTENTGRPIYQNDTSISLESWHDDIHGLIGTGNGYAGHMGDPAIAGV